MPKRKFQIQDDEAPHNEKRARKTGDVIDCVCDHDFTPSALSTSRQEKSWHFDLVSPDQVYWDTPGQETKIIPGTSAAPPFAVNEDYQIPNGTPSGIAASMPVTQDSDRYNMSHPNRGKCIVFNHETFERSYLNREGSSVDVKRIETSFRKLGFEVAIHNNLKHSDVLDEIKKLSEAEHSDNDCVCVFVLTHGYSQDLIWAKDAIYDLDKIWKPFTADNCPTLAGKPKLFFLQACRGDQSDGGVTLMSRSGITQTDSAPSSYKIPTHADFLIAHSSVKDQYAGTTDLLRMLTITARKVATDFESYNDMDQAKNQQKQVPSATSMLTRELYFTPK